MLYWITKIFCPSIEQMPLINQNDNVDLEAPPPSPEPKTCCRMEIIDKSEPLIIVGTLCSLVGFIYSFFLGSSAFTVITGIVTVSGAVSEWRVRALGIAKKLMDSIRDLKAENAQLKSNVEKFEGEVEKFQGIVGLLDGNIQDIEAVKKQLFDLYEKYRIENTKHTSNNLLTLFGLVDKNQDSKLDSEEMSRMKEYIKIVYKKDFDFNILDRDGDGCVSLKEFFEKFRKHQEDEDMETITL